MAAHQSSEFNPTRKNPERRRPQLLPAAIDKRLLAYAVAAGAGLVMAGQPASASVIYTPANTPVLPNTTVTLNLDHNAVNDFNINHSAGSWTLLDTFGWAALWASGAQPGNSIRGSESYASNFNASCCSLGNSSGSFTPSALMAGMWGGSAQGPFVNVTDGYLGLKFDINGATHYGWARFDVSTSGINTIDATLTGYAYESLAGAPVHIGGYDTVVPEPGTLGLLALGFLGLGAWRRRKLKKA